MKRGHKLKEKSFKNLNIVYRIYQG